MSEENEIKATPSTLSNSEEQTVFGDPAGQNSRTIARLEKELALIRHALTLVGLKACSQCGKFFRTSDTAALFDAGESVCMDCLPQWWPVRCHQLSTADRDVLERRLVNWLVNHRGGKVIKKERPGDDGRSFHMAASCVQCDGAGTFAGTRCAACDGRGTVWVEARS